METHGVTPTPANYEVWLAYHGGGHPDLKVEMERHMLAGRQIDDVLCEALYLTHFADLALSHRVAQAGGRIASEINGVMRDLKSVGARTEAYGSRLQHARTQLSKTNAGADVRHVIDSLSDATSEMANQSQDLQNKLLEASREVSVLREQLEQVRVEATTDSLTGVANRKAFETHLSELAKAADAGGGPLSMIMCDIDFFKRVNDSFGHLTGDQVIRFVATVMQRAAPDGAVVARLGGEEFVLLCPRIDANGACALAERIRMAVENKRLVRRASNEDLGQITVSLGVAERLSKEEPVMFLERADAALYASKRGGRNRATLAPHVARVQSAA